MECACVILTAFISNIQLKTELKSLSTPLPKMDFQGSSDVIELLMQEFRTQCAWAREAALSVHQLCLDLVNKLQAFSSLARKPGEEVDYSETVGELRAMEEEAKREEDNLWGACERRQRRWDLTIQLNLVQDDIDKVCVCSILYIDRHCVCVYIDRNCFNTFIA